MNTPVGCSLCGAPNAKVCCYVDGPSVMCCTCVVGGLAVLHAEERDRPDQPQVLAWLLADCLTEPTPALVAVVAALGLEGLCSKPPWTGPRAGAGEPWCAQCGVGRRRMPMVMGGLPGKSVNVCQWCLVESARLLRVEGQHAFALWEVLQACIAALPRHAPSPHALPLLTASAVLVDDGERRRELAALAVGFGCFHWAASIYEGFVGDARREIDVLRRAEALACIDGYARIQVLLESVAVDRLEPAHRLDWLYARLQAALEARQTSTTDRTDQIGQIGRWHNTLDHLAPLVAGDAALDGTVIGARAMLAILGGDPDAAETLYRSLFRCSSLDELHLGDLLARRGDDQGAHAVYARGLAGSHPESWLAAQLTERLRILAPPPPPDLPYR